MKNNIRNFIFIIICLIYFKGFSQEGNKISVESGLVINKPLLKTERIQSNGESTTSYDFTFKYYNSTGYYIKLGYEASLYSKNKFSFIFPMGLSYMTQITKFYQKGYWVGCFGGGSADEIKLIKNNNVILFLGPMLQFENKKFKYSGTLYFNNCMTINSKFISTPNDSNNTYTGTDKHLKYNLYVSSQFNIMYNFTNNIWIGLSCEIFYGNILFLYTEIRNKIKYNHAFSNNNGDPININGKNILINPAIKLQINLK